MGGRYATERMSDSRHAPALPPPLPRPRPLPLSDGTVWTVALLLRHTAFHVLDHAWEMEDKDLS